MVPFDYNPRTRVIFGPGTLARLGRLARELGFHRTLLVADRGNVEAGHVHTALRLLETAHVEAEGFHEFEVNPDGAAREWAATFNPRPLDPAGALEILRAARPT